MAVTDEDFHKLLAAIEELSPPRLAALDAAIRGRLGGSVNNYDSRLKGWMRRFNGVATKYFDSYLGWHRACDRNGGSLSASRALAGAWG
jgi:hypothetical protein